MDDVAKHILGLLVIYDTMFEDIKSKLDAFNEKLFDIEEKFRKYRKENDKKIAVLEAQQQVNRTFQFGTTTDVNLNTKKESLFGHQIPYGKNDSIYNDKPSFIPGIGFDSGAAVYPKFTNFSLPNTKKTI